MLAALPALAATVLAWKTRSVWWWTKINCSLLFFGSLASTFVCWFSNFLALHVRF